MTNKGECTNPSIQTTALNEHGYHRLRAKELDLLSSAASSSKQETTDNVPADLSEFYTRLSSIQSYHARHPHLEPASKLFTQGLEELVASDGLTRITETPVVGDPDEDGTPAKPAEPITTIIDPLSSMFTGEESLGRHLDLYTAHTMYVNLPGAKRMGYMAWLQNVLGKGRVAGEEIGKKGKESAGYHEQVVYTMCRFIMQQLIFFLFVQIRLDTQRVPFGLSSSNTSFANRRNRKCSRTRGSRV